MQELSIMNLHNYSLAYWMLR